MPRYPAKLCDLAHFSDTGTLTVSEVALLLEMDQRAVRGLVKAGALQRQPRGTREIHIYVASVRAFQRYLDSPRPDDARGLQLQALVAAGERAR